MPPEVNELPQVPPEESTSSQLVGVQSEELMSKKVFRSKAWLCTFAVPSFQKYFYNVIPLT